MSLDELRKKIDDIDTKLVELLNERAEIVVDIGKLKNKELNMQKQDWNFLLKMLLPPVVHLAAV